MILINFIGLKFSSVKNINDYFLGNRRIHWILACFSIVATETSTLTFISIPGLAYIKGISFLQIAFGYIIGRILVALLLLPKYFEGNLDTVYQFLEKRFGNFPRKLTSVVFHITRILSDSVRLFATAIPLSVILGWDYRISILVIGAATFLYTYGGGVKAVVLTDSIQLFLYILSALTGIFLIIKIIQVPFFTVFERIPKDYLQIISTGLENEWHEIFNSYNLFSGLIGGAFLSFATHGTDHLMVQRILGCPDLKSAQKAMIWSGIIVFFQFALFLLLGLFIRVLFAGSIFNLSDQIIPFFITNYIPSGLRGLMLAGIFAAAMSSLSSSINSISASSAIDIFKINLRKNSDKIKLRFSRLISLFWTICIVLVSVLLSDNKSPLVELGLSIASVTYGGMLGIFFMGRIFKSINDKAAVSGMIAGIITTIIIALTTNMFWPWFVCTGFIVSITTGKLFNIII